MSSPLNHIDKLLSECRQIQEHGHCKDNAAAWVAINDIEIAVNDLRKAFEEKINNSRIKKKGKNR